MGRVGRVVQEVRAPRCSGHSAAFPAFLLISDMQRFHLSWEEVFATEEEEENRRAVKTSRSSASP